MFFLGYCFFGIAIIIIVATIGVASGFVAHRINKYKDKTSSIVVGFSVFIIILAGISGYYLVYLPNSYYHYPGNFDYFRMPLDYPYELSMIDSLDCASITKWKENVSLIGGITHYHKIENVIVGKISDECFFVDETEWFLFNTTTGKHTNFETIGELQQEAATLGLNEELKFIEVQENWDLFWDGH